MTPKSPLDWSLVRRVLLVKLRSIGDTVLLTPCLAALKALNPSIETTVVLEPLSAPLLENHPLVDYLVVAKQSIAARASLTAQLRRRQFDIAFNMHGGTTATILAALCGAIRTVGFKGHRQSWLLRERAPAPDVILRKKTIHSVEQQLALLHWTGLPYPPAPRLSLEVSDNIRSRIVRRLTLAGLASSSDKRELKKFAVVAPSAAFESKRWPASRFAAVVDHLRTRFDLPSVLIAGPGHEHVVLEVEQRVQARTTVMTGLDLKEVMALISLSSLCVGNDSGPMHIAAAFDRPSVVIFGASNPDVWRPWTEAPISVIVGSHVGVQDPIKAISLGQVIEGVDAVLEQALVAGCGTSVHR